MFETSDNSDAFAAELEALARDIEMSKERALDAGAKVLLEAKQTEKKKTYAREEPKGRKPRSGAFRDGDRIERTPEGRRIIMTGPAAAYEGRLANLPTSKDGVNRANPAADVAFEKSQDKAAKAMEGEVDKALLR